MLKFYLWIDIIVAYIDERSPKDEQKRKNEKYLIEYFGAQKAMILVWLITALASSLQQLFIFEIQWIVW
jgi:hypothetical protein